MAHPSKVSERRDSERESDRDLVIYAGNRRSRWEVLVLLALAVVLVAVGAGAASLHLLPGVPNPFAERTTDRSQPVLLRSLQDLSRYEAASGSFEVIVDLDQDARFLPDQVRGKRTLFVGAGSVDAFVGLGGLSSGAVTVSADRRTAQIRLPHAQLERASLDTTHSHVFAEQRGLLDRVGSFLSGNPDSQQRIYELAQQKIQAAAEQSELRTRAEQNTRTMVEGMLRGLGFDHVTVSYQ